MRNTLVEVMSKQVNNSFSVTSTVAEPETATNTGTTGVQSYKVQYKSKITSLLELQSANDFTFRCVDCCYSPATCIKAMLLPCILNGEIAEEIGSGKYGENCYLCLFTPCFVGAYKSVGRNKIFYRTKHSIPGLASDDYILSCVFPWCIIAQLKNQINEEKLERRKALLMKTKVLAMAQGEKIDRI